MNVLIADARAEIERFITERFHKAYGAQVSHFCAHLLGARDVADVARSNRELAMTRAAAQQILADHDAFRTARNWPMRSGEATWSAPARSIARSGMLATTQLSGSCT